jgi:hypothetical protein
MGAFLFSSMFAILLTAVMVFDAATADARKTNRAAKASGISRKEA